MTQEALKLALEELAVRFSEGWHEGIKIDASDIMLLNEAAQALAQRTWVGLIDGEIEVLFQTAAGADEEVHIRFARAVESKLKELNI